MFFPQSLNKNDTIGIITPSHCLANERVEWVRDGISTLKELGYKIKEGKYLWTKDKYEVSAGTIQERVEDLHKMLEDKEIKAIWFSQGGDTSNELLTHIDYSLLTKNPKIIIGLSDVTVLLNAFLAKSGVVTYHGSDPKALQEDWYLKSSYTKSEFDRILCKHPKGTIPPQNPRKCVRAGKATGHFVGGNLQCFRKLIGTPYLPELEGAILILEGLSTNIEEAITLLAHYKSAGIFNMISGVVLGDFYAFDREIQLDSDGNRVYLEDLLLEVTSDKTFPILKTRDFGHRLGNTFVPLGGMGEIDAGRFEWGVC